jgi:hypothetical protein
LPILLSNVSVADNAGGNIGVECPECGQHFDAAPQDGTYSTLSDGSLRRVADFLAAADREQLELLLREVEGLRAATDPTAALGLAERLGWRPPGAKDDVPLRALIKERADAANALMSFLLRLAGLISFILMSTTMTPDEVRAFVVQFLR